MHRSMESVLSSLKSVTDDAYLHWLDQQDYPPKSYLQHPLSSEEELKKYQKWFAQHTPCSLGAYIRMKRVYFLLHDSSHEGKQELYYHFIETPIGQMVSVFSRKGLCLLEFVDRKMLETELKELMAYYQSGINWKQTDDVSGLQEQIQDYFAQKRQEFTIPLDMIGTPFQQSVWQGLLQIGYGETYSYSKQAEYLSNPSAIRAIASANGKNKIAILVPCHRVIKKDGTLGGYGGGLNRKRYLLDLESGRAV